MKSDSNVSPKKSSIKEFLPFMISLTALAFCYGVAVGKLRIFPYQVIALAEKGLKQFQVETGELPWYYKELSTSYPEVPWQPEQAYSGINLVTQVSADRNLSAIILDMEGNQLHHWDLNWFKLWPNPEHLHKSLLPKAKPGVLVHGAVVMDNGDLVFNFSHLGLVRINREQEVV